MKMDFCFHSERFRRSGRRHTGVMSNARAGMRRGRTRRLPGTVSYRVKPYLLFTWAAAMVREPAILDAVEDLIGPDIMVFHTTMWWKTEAVGLIACLGIRTARILG